MKAREGSVAVSSEGSLDVSGFEPMTPRQTPLGYLTRSLGQNRVGLFGTIIVSCVLLITLFGPPPIPS